MAEEKLSLDTSRRLTLMTTARKEYEEFEANVQRMIAVNNNLSANLQAVRCDDCFTWRFMPEEYEAPEGEWTCTNPDHVNFNPKFASCDAPPEDPTLTEVRACPPPPPYLVSLAWSGVLACGGFFALATGLRQTPSPFPYRTRGGSSLSTTWGGGIWWSASPITWPRRGWWWG